MKMIARTASVIGYEEAGYRVVPVRSSEDSLYPMNAGQKSPIAKPSQYGGWVAEGVLRVKKHSINRGTSPQSEIFFF
jgi:hypothetical protein